MELERHKATLRNVISLKKLDSSLSKKAYENIFPNGIDFQLDKLPKWTKEDERKWRENKKLQRYENRKKYYIRKKSILSRINYISKDNFAQYLSSFSNDVYLDNIFFDETHYDQRGEKKESGKVILDLYRAKKDKGLYVFYYRIGFADGSEWVIPLYAGKTTTFLTRFNQYQRIVRGSWYSKCFDAMCDNIIWRFDIYYSLVVITDDEKSKLSEHKVIHDLDAMFNVA